MRIGTGEPTAVEAGEYHWEESVESHRYENMGDEIIEIIEIQSR